jgi:hypothetical protein
LKVFDLMPPTPLLEVNRSMLWRGDEDPSDDNDPVSPENIIHTGYLCIERNMSRKNSLFGWNTILELHFSVYDLSTISK